MLYFYVWFCFLNENDTYILDFKMLLIILKYN